MAGDWASPCAGAADRLCGVIRWAWDPEDVGSVGVGAVILNQFAWSDGAWRAGTVLNPEDGRVYRGAIRPDGPLLLRLRGCAGPFCQTQVWRRQESIPRPDVPALRP